MLLRKAVALGRAASSAPGAAGTWKVGSEVACTLAGREQELAVEALVLPFLCPWITPMASNRGHIKRAGKRRQASHEVAASPSFPSSSRVKLEHLDVLSSSSLARPFCTSSRVSAPPAAASRVALGEVQEQYPDEFWRERSDQSTSSRTKTLRESSARWEALGQERSASRGTSNDMTPWLNAGEESSFSSSLQASDKSRKKSDPKSAASAWNKNPPWVPSAQRILQRIADLQVLLEQEATVGAGKAGTGPDNSSPALSLLLELAWEAAISPRTAGAPIPPAEQDLVQGLTRLILQLVFGVSAIEKRIQHSLSRANRAILVELLLVLNIHAQEPSRRGTLPALLRRVWRLSHGAWEGVIDFAMERGHNEDALIVLEHAASQEAGKHSRHYNIRRKKLLMSLSRGKLRASESSEHSRTLGDAFQSDLDGALRRRDVTSIRALIRQALSSALQHQDWATARNVIIEIITFDPRFKPLIDGLLLSAMLSSMTEQQTRNFVKMMKRVLRQSRTHSSQLNSILHKAEKIRRTQLPEGSGMATPWHEALSSERRAREAGEERGTDKDKQAEEWRNEFLRTPTRPALPTSHVDSIVQWMQDATDRGFENDRPQSVTYALQIRHAAHRQNDFSTAERLLESMIQRGCRPDQAHITPFIESLCAIGRRTDAVRVKNDALGKLGLQPSLRARAALVAAHMLVGLSGFAQKELEELLAVVGKERDLDGAPSGSDYAEQAFRLIQEFAERWNGRDGMHVPLSEDQISTLRQLYARFRANSRAGLANTAVVQQNFTHMLHQYDYLRAERYLARALAAGLQPDKELYQSSKRSGMHIRKFARQLQSGNAARNVASDSSAGSGLQDPALVTMAKMAREAEKDDDDADDGRPPTRTWTDGDTSLAQVLLATDKALNLHHENRRKMKRFFQERTAREERQLPDEGTTRQSSWEGASHAQPLGPAGSAAGETVEEARKQRRSMLTFLLDWTAGKISRAARGQRRWRAFARLGRWQNQQSRSCAT